MSDFQQLGLYLQASIDLGLNKGDNIAGELCLRWKETESAWDIHTYIHVVRESKINVIHFKHKKVVILGVARLNKICKFPWKTLSIFTEWCHVPWKIILT